VVQAGNPEVKILGFAGYSGSGKTTLLEKIIPLLKRRGLTVSVIKHAHHDFDIDRPGKDSFRQREAGAHEVLIASSQRWALMHELRQEAEPTLDELCARLSDCDLVLVEGYKLSAIPKLEVYRQATGHPSLYPDDPHIIAVVTDNSVKLPLPTLDINAPAQVADYILAHFSFNLSP
jgi:molybdopterin-guanine dinucleotide biosynthesis protein B